MDRDEKLHNNRYFRLINKNLQMQHKRHFFFIIALLLIILNTSCTRYKNLVYLQSGSKGVEEVYNATPPDYHIQKRDVLYIRILSLNQEVTQVINSTITITNQFANDASLFIYGYNVSDSGYVEIPVVGKVNVLGKTMEEAKAEIAKQAAVFLKDATVIIKLISFKYTVLGEVSKPGVFQNYNNQLTVLEAISNAGDISAYGDRRKILVVRTGAEGTKTYRLDLTKTDILRSEGFFLLPNDMVYVEPVKSYNFKVNLPVLSVFLSGVSTLILVLNYINK
jgi:polysaccharide export outer membrane protein